MKKKRKESFGRLLWILLLLIILISLTALSDLINGFSHKNMEFSVYTFYCLSMPILGLAAVIAFFLRNRNTPVILVLILLVNLSYSIWLNIQNSMTTLISIIFFGALILYIVKSERVQKIFS